MGSIKQRIKDIANLSLLIHLLAFVLPLFLAPDIVSDEVSVNLLNSVKVNPDC